MRMRSREEPRLLQIGIDRATATVDRLAALHAVARDRDPGSVALPPGGSLVALATCHRLEWYLEGVGRREGLALFAGWFAHHPALEPVSCRQGADAARHLLRVVAGLESAVLGEDQILSQARAAYRAACAARRAGRLLHRLFHAAFRAGRRVRAETALAGGTRSLAGAAVAAVHRRIGSLRGAAILVLGAGEMATLAARLLADRSVGRLIVVNRTAERGAALAARFGGQPMPWEWRTGLLTTVHAAICATKAGKPILDAASLRRAAERRSAPLVVVDLGVPPNVERPAAPGIELFDVDSLGTMLAEEQRERVAAVAGADEIVDEELRAFLSWADLPQGFQVPARSALA
jgi:glutamyl-tRNA reductase